jgi:hypothetical protein
VRPDAAGIVGRKEGEHEMSRGTRYLLFLDEAGNHDLGHIDRSGLWSYGAPDVQDRRAATVTRLFPERLDFAGKTASVAGLELTDLAAYPIGRAFVNRDWNHPAYQILAPKVKALVPFP